jgi:RNA polymerase sigma-70 factor (ECF subfamily)
VEEISTFQAAPRRVVLVTRGLAAGDEEAFREFHTQYFDRLYQFLLVVARGQEHEAQEALQQTLLRVVRYARVFESEDAFWSWLKVVARSAARDAGRKQRRYWALLENFALRGRHQAGGRSPAEDDHLRMALEETLDELDPEDRRLIEGKYLEGATIKELAAASGLTDKAVESRLGRLRRQLRERLIKKLHVT